MWAVLARKECGFRPVRASVRVEELLHSVWLFEAHQQRSYAPQNQKRSEFELADIDTSEKIENLKYTHKLY